ncbi:DUF4890 domain-containing protein [Carboxylicivirga sp. N1Y90]|uniref:DUF4890 domain-containing protein n=1 Tax=Carboxylicivirga fragile TaxID=3417571 RepID=UPI003D33DEB6|nr:hypothetical protein [Marinilabiliaceae bacterium N1Y90]
MRIKDITLGLILVLSTSLSVLAQKKGDINNRIEKETEIMVEELQLNDEQAKQVLDINKKYGQLMADARKSANGNRDEVRSQMKPLRKEHNDSLKKVLTDEQYQKYLKIVEERRNQRKQKNQGGGRR